MPNNTLTPGEEHVMWQTFKATITRAADIISRITASDVLEAQAILLSDGVPLEKVAKIDRAMLAECHLRAIERTGEHARVTSSDLKEKVRNA